MMGTYDERLWEEYHMFRRMSVGSEIDSYCGRCKLVLNHVVTAMVDEQPRRVRCLTCQSEHNHRFSGTKKKSDSKRKSKSRASTPSKSSISNRWRQALAAWDGVVTKPYSIYESFEVDDWVSHSKFGNGLVIEVPSSDRIITLFESGEKMLMQGKQRS